MVQKLFSAELDQLHEMLNFIKHNCRSLSLSHELLKQIIIATEEVLVNIINYGYPNHAPGKIIIDCKLQKAPKGIHIVIEDDGIPFNPLKNLPSAPLVPSKILDKPDTSLGGYGITIFTGLMDDVVYQRKNEKNVLSLTKFV